MLPKELMKTIFSFQECFFYSVQRNTIRNMEKIIYSIIQFRPKFHYWEQKFLVFLPINKKKHLFLEKNTLGKISTGTYTEYSIKKENSKLPLRPNLYEYSIWSSCDTYYLSDYSGW
jgi:hypothetical protein